MVKERLGLFDDPFRRIAATPPAAGAPMRPEHVALAREAAQKSIVLLKNDGDVLPLTTAKKIALIESANAGWLDLSREFGPGDAC
jgi:beta-glucosidase